MDSVENMRVCHNFLYFLLSDIQDTEGTPLGVLGAHRHGEELHQGYFQT
jgi:hypothetical protein